jgi:hypothetical protein
MSGGYNPKVVNPYGWKVQTKSSEFQTPFFFGGSQVPINLGLAQKSYNGSGFRKGSHSITHLGDLDFTTKRGDEVYHRKHHNIRIPRILPFT